MVMQLIFSLSEYDLKYEMDSKQENPVDCSLEMIPNSGRGRRGRDSSRRSKDKALAAVIFQSIQDIKQLYVASQIRETQMPITSLAPVAALPELHDDLE